MPWTKSDVNDHIKGLTDNQKDKWVKIANNALQNCLNNGGTDKECAPKAIQTANSKYKESMNVKESDFDIAKQLIVEAGRKLSKANEGKIKNAIQALQDILKQLTKESMQEAEWFRNKRDIIEQALKDKFGSNDKYIFVKDFSDKEVIYELDSKEGFKTYKVNYTIDDNDVVTFGDPVEVIPKTYYEPVESKEPDKQPQLNEKSIREDTPIKLVEKVKSDGTMPIKIIAPGWGSSGYYSKETLQNAADKYKEGLKMYIDHPTESEDQERPERSTRDIAAVLASDARYEEDGKEGGGLYADAKVFSDYQNFINERGPYIGLSHRASGKAYTGEAEGKEGPIISEIDQAHSVDFVTMPGAGGQIVDLYESYRNTTNTNNQNDDKMSEDMNKKLKEAEDKAKRLEEENKRLKEGQLIAQAQKFVEKQLNDSELPDVTKKRLAESLSMKYVLNDKSEIDETKFKEKIDEAVKEEKDYLSKVMGQGEIKDFGESDSTQNDGEIKKVLEENIRHWINQGYSEEEAKQIEKAY